MKLDRKNFLKNAIWISVVSFSMSLLGILFRTYASNRVGSEVMGLLEIVLSVYFPACTLASSGVYVASTRLCSHAMAKQDGNLPKILNNCLVYGLCFGAGAFLLLFFGAKTIAQRWLSFPHAEIPLKILSFGLPFLAMSNALQGFLLSLRRASYSTVLQITEDLSKIGATILLFARYLEKGPLAALGAMVAGMAIGETVSCFIGFFLYQTKGKKLIRGKTSKGQNYFAEIAKIALPCAFSGYLRSGIGMMENILVPRGLQASGLTAEQTLAVLGKFEGMALPVIIFPATFLTIVSKLLVPEITAENAVGNKNSNIKTTYKTLQWTLTYGIFIGTFTVFFGREMGMAFYHDKTCGVYLTLLAPLVPIIYADRVIDGIMKGYNQQLTTLKINLVDTVFRTLGVWLLLPKTGIKGYIALFCFGTVMNFVFSFASLQKISHVSFPWKEGVAKPVVFAISSVAPLKIWGSFFQISFWIFGIISVALYVVFIICNQKTQKSITRNIFPRRIASIAKRKFPSR